MLHNEPFGSCPLVASYSVNFGDKVRFTTTNRADCGGAIKESAPFQFRRLENLTLKWSKNVEQSERENMEITGVVLFLTSNLTRHMRIVALSPVF